MRLVCLLSLLVHAPALAVERVTAVPALQSPLMPASPALNQLRLDLAAAQIKMDASMPLNALVAAIPTALDAKVSPGVAVTPVPVDALARLQIAQQILGRYRPDEFAQLSADKQDATLNALWDGWNKKGLLGEGKSDPKLARLDALILQGVLDRGLTSANKSVFLGAAVLGYPLADSMWLAHNRIGDALEDNSLRYPEGQRWHTQDGTPEFLGKSQQAQELVDAWGAATRHAADVIRQVRARSRELPRSGVVSTEATARFAALAEELHAANDEQALDYLSDQKDPTFVAFLLDARKPGYYLYNGEGSIVARVLATKAAAMMGVRRLDQTAHDNVTPSTYYYRPQRVVERLQALPTEDAEHAEKEKFLFSGYAARAADLSVAPPAANVKAYAFVDPQFLPGSALESPQNLLNQYPAQATAASMSRYDLPLKSGDLRARLGANEAPVSLDAERWKSLKAILNVSPSLRKTGEDVELRLVSQAWQTRGKLVAKTTGGGVLLQAFALDHLSLLRRTNNQAAKSFLRFLSAAVEGAFLP